MSDLMYVYEDEAKQGKCKCRGALRRSFLLLLATVSRGRCDLPERYDKRGGYAGDLQLLNLRTLSSSCAGFKRQATFGLLS